MSRRRLILLLADKARRLKAPKLFALFILILQAAWTGRPMLGTNVLRREEKGFRRDSLNHVESRRVAASTEDRTHLSIGGAATSGAVFGEYYVAAIGDRIETYRIKNDGLLSAFKISGDYVFDQIATSKAYIYAVAGNGADRVIGGFDVGYIARLSILHDGAIRFDGITPTVGPISSMAVIDNDVIVIGAGRVMTVLDVRSINRPIQVGTMSIPEGKIRSIVSVKNAAVIGGEAGPGKGGFIGTVDLGDFERPTMRRPLQTDEPIQTMIYRDDGHLVAGFGSRDVGSGSGKGGISILAVDMSGNVSTESVVETGHTVTSICESAGGDIYTVGMGSSGRFAPEVIQHIVRDDSRVLRVGGEVEAADARSVNCNSRLTLVAQGRNGIGVIDIADSGAIMMRPIEAGIEAWSAVLVRDMIVVGGANSDVWSARVAFDEKDNLVRLDNLHWRGAGDGGPVTALSATDSLLGAGYTQDIQLAIAGVDIYEINSDSTIDARSHNRIGRPDGQPGSIDDVIIADDHLVVAGGFTGLVGFATIEQFGLLQMEWFDVDGEVYDVARYQDRFMAASNSEQVAVFRFDGSGAVREGIVRFPHRVNVLERGESGWIYSGGDIGLMVDGASGARTVYDMTVSKIFYGDGIGFAVGEDASGPVAVAVDARNMKVLYVVHIPSRAMGVWGNRDGMIVASYDAGVGVYWKLRDEPMRASHSIFLPRVVSVTVR